MGIKVLVYRRARRWAGGSLWEEEVRVRRGEEEEETIMCCLVKPL